MSSASKGGLVVICTQAGDDSAFHYHTGENGTPSISTPVTVPIGEWQTRLEAIAADMDLSARQRANDLDTLTDYQWLCMYEMLRGYDPSFNS